jgi:hypothetical protein
MSDNVTDLTTHILIDIREAIRAQASELGEAIRAQGAELAALRTEMRTELTAVRDEMRGMRVDLCERIDRTNQRIDNLIEVSGGGHRAHDERLARLETRVEKLERSKRKR